MSDLTQLSTPVLFLVFNRPEYTARVWNVISQLKPAHLYIAADGPRDEVGADKMLCQNARMITEKIDWKCDVQRFYRDSNLGCRDAVHGALDWFFSCVPEGIVLEDDTMPSVQFFYFCEQLLSRFRQVEEVMMITGTSYFFNRRPASVDYYFSAFASVWGWASWQRAWRHMRLQPESIDKKLIAHRICHPAFALFVEQTLEAALSGRLNTWDIQWAYSIIAKSGVVVRPFQNLIQNIGCQGAHAASNGNKSIFFEMPFGEINAASLRHPSHISLSIEDDHHTFDAIVRGAGLKHGMISRMLQQLSRLRSRAGGL